jgi:PEP-CTERM motif
MVKFRRQSLIAPAALAVSMLGLVAPRVMAENAAAIEATTPTNNTVTVQYDNNSGYDANGYPVVTAILSQPGTFGGHAYTGWSALVADTTGSLDLFVSATTLAGLTGTPTNSTTTPPYGTPTTTLAVGQGLNIAGQWDPFDGIAELAFNTTKDNYVAVTSTLNTVPTPNVVTIPGMESESGNGANVLTDANLTGQYLEIQNVTITPGNGTTVNPFVAAFPTYAQVEATSPVTNAETYTITDGGGNSMELFDWVTSYSDDGALGGTAVPTGPVDVYGFYDSFNEFVPAAIVAVPEPASMGLLAVGAAMLLRRKARKA